jgi:hypothetical protein
LIERELPPYLQPRTRVFRDKAVKLVEIKKQSRSNLHAQYFARISLSPYCPFGKAGVFAGTTGIHQGPTSNPVLSKTRTRHS